MATMCWPQSWIARSAAAKSASGGRVGDVSSTSRIGVHTGPRSRWTAGWFAYPVSSAAFPAGLLHGVGVRNELEYRAGTEEQAVVHLVQAHLARLVGADQVSPTGMHIVKQAREGVAVALAEKIGKGEPSGLTATARRHG